MLFAPAPLLDSGPLAVLTSFSGVMHIYSEAAFKLFLESEINLKISQALHCQATSTSAPLVIAHDTMAPSDELQNDAIPERLEGFTLQQWAEHAKKKSAIATAVCRRNGELKQRVEMLQGSPLSAPSVLQVDPLCAVDPWLNAKIGTASAPLPDCHARASWVPSKVSPPQLPQGLWIWIRKRMNVRTLTASSLVKQFWLVVVIHLWQLNW